MSDDLFYAERPAPPAVDKMTEAVRAGDYDRAFIAAGEVLATGYRHPLAFKLRGLQRDEQGRHEDALSDFLQALAFDEADAAAHNAVGLAYAKIGKMDEAVAALDKAIELQPGSPPFLYGKAWAFEQNGDLDKAKAAYEDLLKASPRDPQALSGLAWIAAARGDWAGAREAAGPVLTLDANSAKAAISMARAEVAEGKASAAEKRMRGLIASGRPSRHEAGVAHTVLGDALDAQNKVAEAFEAYRAGNDAMRALYAPAYETGRTRTGLAFVEGQLAYFARGGRGDWKTPAPETPSPAAGHAFLLGFARSGTTLLGQALGAHPKVAELDERDTLQDALARFMADPSDLSALVEAGPSDLAEARGAYWNRVRGLGAEPKGKLVLDKLPMNTMKLALIARLFPGAKTIFLHRDPRDVVLSVYRRAFAVGSVNWEFLDLEGAARFYDATMRLYEETKGLAGLEVREQSYEALVGDFEGEMKGLTGFLGLDWDPAVLDVAAAAQAGDAATPSAAQLAGGLSGEGVGAWQRYADQLAPVMPTLEPWIARFGYAE